MCRANQRTTAEKSSTTARRFVFMPAVAAAILLGACANMPKIGEPFSTAEAPPAAGPVDPSKPPQTELERAIEYWGKLYATNPRDLKAAIAYAKNLKAAGEKEKALGVMQAASTHHGSKRELTSEYGRIALDNGQTSLAQKLLEHADDPAKPDWKVISALGTAHAKQGNYKLAIPHYERALALSPEQPSIISNLAMAHAANGEAPKAELMLRKVANAPGSDAKVRQNLALVLSLQGKYEEAKSVVAADVEPAAAAANVDYVRQMVRLAPQAAPKAAPAVNGDAYTANAQAGNAAWSTKLTTASVTKTPAQTDGLKPSQR
jgi:Flp pilus assembly protein TadD